MKTLSLEYNISDFSILFSTRTNTVNELKIPFVKRGQDKSEIVFE